MGSGLMYLFPEDPELRLTDEQVGSLESDLRRIGFYGEVDADPAGGELHYRAGPRIAELLVPEDPERGPEGAWLYPVERCEPGKPPAWKLNPHPDPACPGCGEYVEQWPDWLEAFYDREGEALPCPTCGREASAIQLDWRQTSGFASTWLDVQGVAFHEVWPSDELLGLLREAAGCDWTWSFAKL